MQWAASFASTSLTHCLSQHPAAIELPKSQAFLLLQGSSNGVGAAVRPDGLPACRFSVPACPCGCRTADPARLHRHTSVAERSPQVQQPTALPPAPQGQCSSDVCSETQPSLLVAQFIIFSNLATSWLHYDEHVFSCQNSDSLHSTMYLACRVAISKSAFDGSKILACVP